MQGSIVADMGCGSGTYSNAAMLRRRHALALDFDITQEEGFYKRVVHVQHMIAAEHKRLKVAKDTLHTYRRRVHRWNYVCNVEVNSLRSLHVQQYKEQRAAIKKLQDKEKSKPKAEEEDDVGVIMPSGEIMSVDDWLSEEQILNQAVDQPSVLNKLIRHSACS